jgi:hypothetical protein
VRIKHGDIDAFGIHRFELNFGSPAARSVAPENILFLIEVLPPRGIVLRRGFACPLGSIRMHEPEIAHVMTGDAAGRQRSEFRIDIALPQIRRLHDMHVAVDDFESIFRHD